MEKLFNKKSMNEQQVLKKLGIEDFRHLSKEKVVKFVSMVPYMEPEVAKLAINQYPEFANTMKSITTDYRAEVEAGLKSNDDSMKSYYESAKIVLNSLDKLLENENLSQDEKMNIVDKMQAVLKIMYEKDSENKRFLREIIGMVSLAGVFIVGISATLLGGNIKFPDKKN